MNSYHRGYRGSKGWDKRMEKDSLFRDPRAGRGQLGCFIIGPVWPNRLGRSLRSRLVRNTNITNSAQLIDSYNTHSHNMWAHASFFISIKCFHSQNHAYIIPFSCAYLFLTKDLLTIRISRQDWKEFHAVQVARPQPLEKSNSLPQYSS
jgi:hypothetical protein